MSILLSESRTPIDLLSYEQAFSELESVVHALESGEHALDIVLKLFDRGQALAKHCAALLDQAELKIQAIDNQGLVDFQPQE